MRTFRFYSATIATGAGCEEGSHCDIELGTFEEALFYLNEKKATFDEGRGIAFIPVYFEEIGNLSGKVREK